MITVVLRRRKVQIVKCYKSALMVVLAVAFILCFAPDVMAQESRIVYIDSYRIRQEYKEFQDAQEQFNSEIDEWNQEGFDMQKELDSLKTDLEKKRLFYSPDKLAEAQDVIATKEAALQKFTNDIFGPNGRAERRNTELTQPLLDKVTQVLEKIAIENNYLYILDAVNGNIAYAKKTLDITDKVLEELAALQ